MMATDHVVDKEIKQGWFFFAGQRMQIPGDLRRERHWNLNGVQALGSSSTSRRTAYRRSRSAACSRG